MGRQAVHLSETKAENQKVGQRHAPEPLILRIDSHDMVEDGHQITKRGQGIYTTNEVPPEYIAEASMIS